MILLEAGATVAGRAGSAASLTVTIFGQETTNDADPTKGAGKVLYQGQPPAADTVLYTVAAFKAAAIRHIAVANGTGADVSLKLWEGGVAAGNLILPPVVIPAGAFAQWHDGEWTFYDASGHILLGSPVVLTVQESGVAVTTPATLIDLRSGFDVTNPTTGEAEVALDASEVSGAPAASAVGDSAATGADALFANKDHRHAREGFAAPGSSAVGDAAAAGTATTIPHSDHVHGREAFAAPAASAPGDAGTTGVATTLPHSDHKHARESWGLAADIASSAVADAAAAGATGKVADAGHRHAREAFGSPAASAVGDAAADGTATTEARSDHKHAREAFAAPASSAPGDASTTGVAVTVPHSDHKHARESFGAVGDIAASAVADTAAAGASAKVADAAHRHAREGFGSPVASAVGDTGADGTATTEARSDHKHGREAFGTPGSSAVGDSVAAGTATTEARADHRHGREAFGSPVKIATANSDGTATTEARADHVHDGLGKPQGLTGATAATNYVGATTSGAPVSGTFAKGDFLIGQDGTLWICTTAGSPGTWTQVSGGGSSDPLAYGIAWTVDPRQANAAQAESTNRCLYHRVHGSMTVASLGIHVGTASGNISGAVYNTTGTGRAAKPNSRQQTTGAVACPAAGYATIALGASTAVTQGNHWFALAADNGTVTIFGNADPGSSLTDGFKWQEAAAHPPPATATGATSATARSYSIVGV